MKTTTVIAALLALLVLAACTPRAMPAAQTATDRAVADVSGDVADVDGLTQDMDTTDLNTLDQELSDVDNLELQ